MVCSQHGKMSCGWGALVLTIYANHVVGQLLMAMNKNQFNLFSAVQLGPAGADKKNHLIFKTSTVRFDNTMCVHLSGN